jgi:hypothetical protein
MRGLCGTLSLSQAAARWPARAHLSVHTSFRSVFRSGNRHLDRAEKGCRRHIEAFLYRFSLCKDCKAERQLSQPYSEGRAAISYQSALAEIAEITSRGAFDEVDRKFKQTNFPSIIDALNDCTERFVFVFDLMFRAINYRVN